MNMQADEIRTVCKTQTNSCTTLEYTLPARILATESSLDELLKCQIFFLSLYRALDHIYYAIIIIIQK